MGGQGKSGINSAKAICDNYSMKRTSLLVPLAPYRSTEISYLIGEVDTRYSELIIVLRVTSLTTVL